MILKRYFLIIALILFYLNCRYCTGGEISEKINDLIVAPPFEKGDVTASYIYWLEYALDNSENCLSEIALLNALSVNSMDMDFRDKNKIEELLKNLIEKSSSNPFLNSLANDLYIKYLIRNGKFTEAKNIDKNTGAVQDWFVCGPFGLYAYSSFYEKFQPESAGISKVSSYNGSRDQVEWKRCRIAPFDLKFYPYSFIYPDNNVSLYIATEFTSPINQNAIIEVETNASWKAWFNNSQIFINDNIKKYSYKRNYFPVKLTKDSNRIMFKIFYPDSNCAFKVKILDINHKPFKNLKFLEKLPFKPITQSSENITEIKKDLPQRFSLFAENLETASAQALYALYYESQNIPDKALKHAERAVDLDPENLAFKYLLVQAYSSATHLPGEIRSNRKRKLLKEIINSNPGYVPALLTLAELEKDDEKIKQSIGLLEKALEVNSGSVPAFRKKIDLFLKESWFPEAEKDTEVFIKAFPENVAANIAKGKISQQLRLAENAMNAFHNARINDLSSFALWQIEISYLLNIGKTEKAEQLLMELLELCEGIPAIHAQAADLFSKMSFYKKALAQIRKACDLIPENEAYWLTRGELLYKLGKTREAVDSYKKSLRLDPSQHNLRRLICRLTGKNYAFWQKYKPDIMESIAKSRATRYVGSTVRLIDQTVMRVYEDGSRVETINELQKILTRSGISGAAEVNIMGEVLEARTILNEKTYLEPVRLPGKQSFTMPGLRENSYIEYLFLLSHKNRYDYTFHAPCWFFRSPDSTEKFVFTQYIIQVPENYPFKYIQRNFNKEPKIETFNGLKTYTWTMRNMERVPSEEGTPNVKEFLPYVEVGANLSWEKVANLLRNFYFRRLQPTIELENLAEKLTDSASSEMEKINNIYRYVMDNINDSSSGNRASIINARKQGNRILLLLALFRIAGIDADYALIRPGKDYLYEPNWELPQPDIFTNRAIAVYPKKSNNILWLDTRYEDNTPETILEDFSGATAFVISDTGFRFHTLPRLSSEDFSEINKCEISLPEKLSDSLTITGSNILQGKVSALTKSILKNSSEKEKVQAFEGRMYKRFDNFTSVKLDLPTLHIAGKPYTEKYTAEIGHFLNRFTNSLYKMPLVFEKLQIVEDLESDPEERQNPYRISQYHVSDDVVVVKLNGIYMVEKFPDNVVLKNSYGYYSLTFKNEADRVIIRRKYSFAPVFMEKKDFPGFVKDLRMIRKAEEESVTLSRITIKKGE